MSGKPQQKGQQQQKRKADAPAQPESKKQKGENKPAAAAAPAKADKPQQAAKKVAAPQQQSKKSDKPAPKKAAAPVPEPEEESEDDDEHAGERDEAALALIEKLQPAMDTLVQQLESLDEAGNAEIYVIRKKFALKKRPLLLKRDEQLAKAVPGLWKTLLQEHEVFLAQLEDVDREILDNLVGVEVEEQFGDKQIAGVQVAFVFSAGNAHVKAGKFKKQFTFNEESESLDCVPTPANEQPFVAASKMSKDSFFVNWFGAEGQDDGILVAQDAITSELYVDPLQLYRHVAEGGSLQDLQEGGDDGADMMFGSDDESDDGEAPDLADE